MKKYIFILNLFKTCFITNLKIGFRKQNYRHSTRLYSDFYKEIELYYSTKYKFSIYKCTYSQPNPITFYVIAKFK